MLSGYQKLRCPYCCALFTTNNVRFRCIHPHCRGRTTDLQYNRIAGEKDKIRGRVLQPVRQSFWPGALHEELCDVCRRISNVRICPECHVELPADIEKTKTYFIALLGNSQTGKTHYLASLLSCLQHESGMRSGLTIQPLGELATARWNKYYAPLFQEKKLLPATRSAEVDSQQQYPITFRLTINTGPEKKAFSLGFFDISGDDMCGGDDRMLKQYLEQADGILYCIDPLNIDRVRQQSLLPPITRSVNSVPEEQSASLLRDWLESAQRVRPREKVDLPVAFVLTRIDEIRQLLGPGSPLLRPVLPQKHHLPVQLQSVSTEVSALLSSWLDPQFGQTIRSEFASYAYFGVSALGRTPEANQKIGSAISPIRVEDPFLWLLLQLKLIKMQS